MYRDDKSKRAPFKNLIDHVLGGHMVSVDNSVVDVQQAAAFLQCDALRQDAWAASLELPLSPIALDGLESTCSTVATVDRPPDRHPNEGQVDRVFPTSSSDAVSAWPSFLSLLPTISAVDHNVNAFDAVHAVVQSSNATALLFFVELRPTTTSDRLREKALKMLSNAADEVQDSFRACMHAICIPHTSATVGLREALGTIEVSPAPRHETTAPTTQADVAFRLLNLDTGSVTHLPSLHDIATNAYCDTATA